MIKMTKKRKRGFFDGFFDDFFGDIGDIFDIPLEGGMGGYSIEIRTTPEGTEVHAQVHGNVDTEKLKKRLENMYPGAKIVIEGEQEESKPLIVREDEHKVERKQEVSRGVEITFRKGEPIIRRVDEEAKTETKEDQKKKQEEKSKGFVEITFKKGKPIIKRIE